MTHYEFSVSIFSQPKFFFSRTNACFLLNLSHPISTPKTKPLITLKKLVEIDGLILTAEILGKFS